MTAPSPSAVFGDYSDYETWRAAVWDKHSVQTGFRLTRAYDADLLVGFAYGYTGEHGQWWTDNALKVLKPDIADAWLGEHFELVSIGVLDGSRRGGIGWDHGTAQRGSADVVERPHIGC